MVSEAPVLYCLPGGARDGWLGGWVDMVKLTVTVTLVAVRHPAGG